MWSTTLIAGARATKHFAAEVWRLVEDQARAATVRLVDSLEEQRLLEELLERTKPPWPPECSDFHYLIATPFRYRPYPTGSRFRRAGQVEGAYYASEDVGTSVAELAFYRAFFFAEAPGTRQPDSPVAHCAFSVHIESPDTLDLTAPPLVAERSVWTHPSDYGPCQDLADQARRARIEIIRYESVRAPMPAFNVAVLAPAAIIDRKPRRMQTWHLFVRSRMIEAWCEHPRQTCQFLLADWNARDPRIPPALL